MGPHRHTLVACLAGLVALAACAPAASAAVPAQVTVADPLVASNGQSLGEMRFTVTHDSDSAGGRVISTSLRLRSGGTFRIRTCVSFKAPDTAPQSQCEQTQLKVNFLSALTGLTAPAVGMTVARPPSGKPAGTIAGRIIIDEYAGAEWHAVANSWPREGLAATGVPVPAVDQTSGPVLPPQGGPLAGVRPGGINDRTQDSICLPVSDAGGGSRGSTTALGSLPFPYEVEEPANGKPAVGTMILLHGGGWFQVGNGVMQGMRGEADRWRSRGWRTVNSSYRACGASSEDVVAVHDRVVATYGRQAPTCASGQSSGGHLALLLAALRPSLACVISEGGPADLLSLAGQSEPDAHGQRSSFGPITVVNMAVAAFGADRLASMSPTRLTVRARTLFALAAQDVAIPFAQARGFVAAQKARNRDAYVDTLHLGVGDVRWVHGLVSPKSLSALREREKLLVAPLVTASLAAPKAVRVRSLRRSGLRVSFSCPTSCTVTARLTLGARRIATGKARRVAFGAGRMRLRLSGAARKRLRAGTARLVADVRSGAARKRLSRKLVVRG